MKKFKFKKIYDDNLTAKIISLVIAIFFWSYVMGVENPTETMTIRNVRVNFENVESLENKGLILINQADQFVNIKVSGKKNELNKLKEGSVLATVDLKGFGVGDSRAMVSTRFESNPGNIQVENVTPRDVLVSIDKVITKEMAVKIDTLGTPVENYIVGEISTTSPNVKIKGPKATLDKVRGLVSTIDISDKKESFTISNPVKAVDENGDELVNIEAVPNVINISVPIFQTVIKPIELKTKGNLPTLLNIKSYDINPSTITLKVLNDVKIPQNITTEEVDLSAINKNTSIKLKLNIPDGLVPIDETIEYKLNLLLDNYAIRRVEIKKSQIEFVNLPDGLKLKENEINDTYFVDLKGPEDLVTTLDAGNLSFICDLGNAHLGLQRYEIILQSKDANLSLNNPVTIDLNMEEDSLNNNIGDNNENNNNNNVDENDNNDIEN
ncbi:MAG: CdaR family protein [Ezakiella sp.]|nr:CdaR family protein [Ezakiella sp.]MDD7471801.1 CdaR family protein [Bacillota bacterium]MDY3923766.1 CdaR family protein [Ezakiella sp.]